jgi:dienelactone hydrolase
MYHRPMTATARTVVAAVTAIALVVTLVPYWHAAAMIFRAAGTPGWVAYAARFDARPVTGTIEHVSTPDGLIRARIFVPSPRGSRAALLVTGVHPDGIDEVRLLALARDLAATGVNVVTPEIPDLLHYRLTGRVTDTIEHMALWLATNTELSRHNRIGMIGVSFSGGLSIVAAGRPSIRDRVAYVLSFGGHGNLPRVLTFLCTGQEPSIDSRNGATRVPHDYALAILLHQAADLAVPGDQVEPLRHNIETFLQASALARVDQQRAADLLEHGRLFQTELADPAATLMKFVFDRNVAALGARLVPYLDRLGQDPALSPDRSDPPKSPVYLLHGTDDNVIPAVESELLAAHLEGGTRVRVLLSRFLTHVDVTDRPTLAATWRMVAFWKGALGEQ